MCLVRETGWAIQKLAARSQMQVPAAGRVARGHLGCEPVACRGSLCLAPHFHSPMFRAEMGRPTKRGKSRWIFGAMVGRF